jgi:putative restriction endonuclease
MEKISWERINEKSIVKELDVSSFLYQGSNIPQDFYSFFNVGDEDQRITLIEESKKYDTDLKWQKEGRENSPAVRIFWRRSQLDGRLKEKFPNWVNRKPGDKLSNMRLVFERTSDPKIFNINLEQGKPIFMFGHVPGVRVGEIFESRQKLREAGIHAGRPQYGIWWGREKKGSCAIVLSGGYEDNIDELDYIRYTGEGGHDKKSRKQVADQEFTGGNKALQLNCEYGLPVRVTRGHQTPDYGPKTGYRYDGLYYVTDFERVKGKSGFYVCRFHLESELSIDELEKTSLGGSLPNNYGSVGRTEVTSSRPDRKVELSERIKGIYEYKCQVCKVYLKRPHGAIAISAHIKQLGKPDNGPDIEENMLCLCPNCHAQFDAHSFYIDPKTRRVHGVQEYEGKKINLSNKHKLDSSFLEYHKKKYENKNN